MTKKEQKRPVITINDVSKSFSRNSQASSSLKRAFLSLFSSKRRKGSSHNDRVEALSGISLEVFDGEFLGIVGKNGGGKSTLLKVMAGIYPPTSGEVVVNGRLVPFIELGVGFNPELSGKDNVYLNGALLGFSRKEIDEVYDQIVDFAELNGHMDKQLKNYSSGMQVRLAFSIAIRADGDVLLIDEVLAVGDSAFQRKCFDYFKDLRRKKKTVVLVTHDMESVRRYCDRVILLNDKKVAYQGSPLEAASRYDELNQRPNVKSADVAADVQSPKKSKRWGSGTVKMKYVKSTKTSYSDDDKSISLKVRVHANSAEQGLYFGFHIEDQEGRIIMATNTKWINNDPVNMQASQDIDFTWTLDNLFADGEYSVQAVIFTDDGTIVDRWPRCAQVLVSRHRESSGIVSPEVEFKVQQ